MENEHVLLHVGVSVPAQPYHPYLYGYPSYSPNPF